MRKILLFICILVLFVSNLFSQKLDDNFSTQVDTGYITVDGGKLYYEIAGKGDYIVLLHDGVAWPPQELMSQFMFCSCSRFVCNI